MAQELARLRGRVEQLEAHRSENDNPSPDEYGGWRANIPPFEADERRTGQYHHLRPTYGAYAEAKFEFLVYVPALRVDRTYRVLDCSCFFLFQTKQARRQRFRFLIACLELRRGEFISTITHGVGVGDSDPRQRIPFPEEPPFVARITHRYLGLRGIAETRVAVGDRAYDLRLQLPRRQALVVKPGPWALWHLGMGARLVKYPLAPPKGFRWSDLTVSLSVS